MSENLMIEKTVRVEEIVLVDKKVTGPNWDLITTGTKFKGTIGGSECEGRILIEGNKAYFCQNVISGDQGSSTLGYEYSWVVYIDSPHAYDEIYITSLELDPEFKYDGPVTFPVGNYTCKVHVGYIQVGCTKVDNDLVREIASKLIDKSEE